MLRNTLASQPTVPQALRIPLSARLMRVFQPRYITGVAWVEVIVGGSGFADTFPVTFVGTGGGASGVGRARGGVLQCVDVQAYGNYVGVPTANVSAGGGVGAVLQVHMVDPGADAQALGITHVMWCYLNGDATFEASITSRGIALQGTVNGLVSYPAQADAAALAYNGQPVPVVWLFPEARAFGAVRRRAFWDLKLSELQQLRFVNMVQMDDPTPDSSSVIARAGVSRSGGSFDPETLASFDQSYVSRLQNAGITQDNFDWNTLTWPTSTGNWLTQNPAFNAAAPSRDAYLRHLREGAVDFNLRLTAAMDSKFLFMSGNLFDALPRVDFPGYIMRSFKVCLHETETPEYSGAAPVDYAQRFTRLFLNIETAKGAGTDDAPQLQPIRNDQTYASTRAMRVEVLKQQTALAYALGARPLYPYDIYLYPWDSGPNERWFAKASEGFGAFYDLPRLFPELFDDTRSHGALLLACDVETNFNRAVSNANILGWADECLRYGVPVIVYMLGGSYSRQPELEAKAMRVVDCSTPSAVTAALSSLPNYRTIAQLPFTSWRQYSAVALAGTFTDVFAIPRVRDDGLVVHVVNMDGVARAGLVLTVRWWALASFRRSRIRWYALGATTPTTLQATTSDAGLRVSLPSVTHWGILRIESWDEVVDLEG